MVGTRSLSSFSQQDASQSGCTASSAGILEFTRAARCSSLRDLHKLMFDLLRLNRHTNIPHVENVALVVGSVWHSVPLRIAGSRSAAISFCRNRLERCG